MEKKYLVEHEISKKVFFCLPHQLKSKIEEAFHIREPFHLQVYDDNLEVWADATQIEALPSKSHLKVFIGKNMSLFEQYNCAK